MKHWLRRNVHNVFIGWILLPAVLITGCSLSKNPLRTQIKELQRGTLRDDTSYVYSLPFKPGKKFRILQGYFSPFTHKERAALDFNMKRGTAVHAARGGVVVRVKEDGKRGGAKRKYRAEGNNIVIQHADGTRAGYWHFQYNGAVVQTGDTVQQGQLIGYSGKTGYAWVPHLHFIVWRFEKGNWQQLATRFQTTKGIRYLRNWKKYQRPL